MKIQRVKVCVLLLAMPMLMSAHKTHKVQQHVVVNQVDTVSFNAIHVDKSWVQFLSPNPVTVTGYSISGTLSLPYVANLKRYDYQRVVDSLQHAITHETSTYGTHLLSIQLTGYGAPMGNRQKNEIRAAAQTLKLRRLLAEKNILGENELRVSWISEDWDSIRQLVADFPIPLQTAASDIITNIPVDQGREQALRTLGSGSTYEVMRHEVFPRVCRLNYQLAFSPRPTGVSQKGAMPASITPDNFYQTAMAFEVGSQEFCDMMDLAGRLFPDCAEAAIDAAGVALMRGDAKRARRYLSKWSTDRRAWCNLGLLHLLEGNHDKAEVYLSMAAADGVLPASEALKTLRNGKKY